jgi:Flp pilus assembly protein TadG
MKKGNRNDLIRDQQGAAAIEFAIVGPIFLMLVIGMLYSCIMLFSLASMHDAVQDGARCASVKTTVCKDSATTIAYTQAAYSGPLNAPVFTYSTAACGHVVTGTTNFSLYFYLTTLTVPLSATACFP